MQRSGVPLKQICGRYESPSDSDSYMGIQLYGWGNFVCQNIGLLNLCMEIWGSDKQHSVNATTVKSGESADR